MSDLAYKLVERSEWATALAARAYTGSAVDLADGFIHMSTEAQLAETARRHYAGRDDLVLVAVDLTSIGEALKWEPSRGGELFPHLYAPLSMAFTLNQRRLSVDEDGVMRFEDGALGWP